MTTLYEPDINRVELIGCIYQAPSFSYTFHDRPIYEGMMCVERNSGVADYIPIVGEKHILAHLQAGERISAIGRILTRGKVNFPDARHRLSAHISEFIYATPEQLDSNKVYLSGHVCRAPYARVTTKTHRDICEITLAIQRGTGEQDYCTCIAWNKLARVAALFDEGDAITLTGRFQSRDYTKVLGDGSHVRKMAHEISVTSFD